MRSLMAHRMVSLPLVCRNSDRFVLPDWRVQAVMVFLCVCACCAIGCKRRGESSISPAPPPATRPASRSAQPVTLNVDGTSIAFPPAELRLAATGGGVVAHLSMPPTDSGNSLYFDIVLEDIDDPANIDGAVWEFKNDDSQRSDTLNGIFLRGRAVVMEPQEVQ